MTTKHKVITIDNIKKNLNYLTPGSRKSILLRIPLSLYYSNFYVLLKEVHE